MKKINFIFIILVIFIIILSFILILSYFKWKDKTKLVLSKKNEYFLVQNNKDEDEWVSKEVSNRLSRLAEKIDILVLEMLNTSYPSFDVSRRLAKRWNKIRNNPYGLRETDIGENTAGYTVSKGKEIRICVRNNKNKNKKFEDENTMCFILLHELGHLASKSYGHNTEFKENFSAITQKALELGIYKYEDFKNSNKEYCGIKITNSPI